MSMTRITAMCLMLSMLTGCAGGVGRWMSWSHNGNDSRQARAVRKRLKDPVGLDLAYAKWQEQQGNTTDAREHYQRVLHEEPQSIEALLGLARLDQLANRMTEAEQGYRKALKLAPNDPRALDALGQFYAAQEKWPQAIDILKQALQAAPKDDTIRFHLAVATAKSGDLATARSLFINCVGEAEADYNLGLILHEQGKLELSEQYFVQALVKKPTLEQAQFWLDEIRVEKETKSLLAGTNGRPRPEMRAPNGALPTSTTFYPAVVNERRMSPHEVMGIQQTSGQNSAALTHPGRPAGGVQAPEPNTGHGLGFQNPFATGSIWGHNNSAADAQSGLTPQQLEQLRNQR
jgi:tetratricopeptide (TPR) repeat protein